MVVGGTVQLVGGLAVRLWHRPRWLVDIVSQPGAALQRSVRSNTEYLTSHLRAFSIANVAQGKGTSVTKEQEVLFNNSVATITAAADPTLLWWAMYAHQYTQERREIDRSELAASTSRSVVMVAVLAVAVLFQHRGTVGGLALVVALSGSVLVAAAATRGGLRPDGGLSITCSVWLSSFMHGGPREIIRTGKRFECQR